MARRMQGGGTPAPAGAGRILVGWKEYADFPAWGLARVKVKVDTGARTSALGAFSYELRAGASGELIAELHLGLHRKHPQRRAVVHTPVLRMVTVRNSSGAPEERPLIETEVQLGPVRKRVLMTVSNRAKMRFPVILGRKALENDFIVDVSQKYLLRRKTAARREPGPPASGAT